MRRVLRYSIFLALALGVSLTLLAPAPRAEDSIDLTLTFQGAVHGEVAPCG
jgi:hypothetical protein